MAMLAEDAPQPWIGWEYLAWIISGAAMLLVLVGIILAIRRIFEQFRTRPEENGDVAVSLEPEDEVQILESGRVIPKIFLTEDEKIRRRFRRMILKNRKDRPAPAETPLEMEKIAGIDQKQDVRLLHEEYERVRYGTGTR